MHPIYDVTVFPLPPLHFIKLAVARPLPSKRGNMIVSYPSSTTHYHASHFHPPQLSSTTPTTLLHQDFTHSRNPAHFPVNQQRSLHLRWQTIHLSIHSKNHHIQTRPTIIYGRRSNLRVSGRAPGGYRCQAGVPFSVLWRGLGT